MARLKEHRTTKSKRKRGRSASLSLRVDYGYLPLLVLQKPSSSAHKVDPTSATRPSTQTVQDLQTTRRERRVGRKSRNKLERFLSHAQAVCMMCRKHIFQYIIPWYTLPLTIAALPMLSCESLGLAHKRPIPPKPSRTLDCFITRHLVNT